MWGVFANYGFMVVPFGLYIIAATAEPIARRSICRRRNRNWWRASTGVFGLSVGAVLPGGVREHFRGVERGGGAVLGGWLRPFPSVKFLEAPLNYGTPVLLFVGSGLATFR